MYARGTTFKTKPGKIAEVEARIPDIRKTLKSIKGLTDCYVAWNGDGTGMTLAIYDSKASADAATGQIQQVWGGLAELLAEMPTLVAYEKAERISA